jgi:mono/diheme cytochrome c family protein
MGRTDKQAGRRGSWFALTQWSTLTAITAAALLALSTLQARSDDAVSDWTAPPRAARKRNPFPADERSRAIGKSLYACNCQTCHGIGGHGDGPSAITCEPRPCDLSDTNIMSQSDGALFWKITSGRKPMPSYQNQLTDEQRWHIVNYLRALGSPPATQPAEGEKR